MWRSGWLRLRHRPNARALCFWVPRRKLAGAWDRRRKSYLHPRSERFVAALSGADAHHLVDRQDEDLAVADAAGLGGLLDGLDHLRDLLVRHDHLELHLGQEVHDVLRAAVELGVTLLTTEALHLGHRQALRADRAQALLHLVELERLDDRFDLLHRFPPGQVPSYRRLAGMRPGR